MNINMIAYIIGYIMKVEAFILIIPTIVGIIYKENTLISFLLTILLLLVSGFAISRKKPKNSIIFAKEGFVIVALAWIIFSAFGAMPFYFSQQIPSYIDCFFETVSGFTTTGASILKEVEGLSKSLLFWRSFTHWIGGMGFLVFVLAIIPLAGSRSMYLMKAEVPGPTVGKLVPKIKSTAMILYGMYIFITIVEIILLLIGGMPLFDSLVNSFGTAGTGGFAVKNISIAAYNSPYAEYVISIFMILFGINFNLYYFILLKNFKEVFKSEELKCYIGIIAFSVIIITFNINHMYSGISESFRYALFQVGSIITTTGYSTTDFNLWPELSKSILCLLMIIGACAGSTGGGIKISRLLIIFKSLRHEVKHMLHPRLVNTIKFENKTISNSTIHATLVFFCMYIFLIFGTFLLISVDGFDFETTMTAVLACINNIGPGLGGVGPMSNFSDFSDFSKILLSLNMLLGRLEIFPIIMLFSPSVWKRT